MENYGRVQSIGVIIFFFVSIYSFVRGVDGKGQYYPT